MQTIHKITVDGHALAVLELNPGAAGEPIVLLHGINQSPQFWRTDEVFVRHGRCYALGLPGHTSAGFPAGFRASDLTPELIARLLACAIRQLAGDRPITLVGVSTGGFATLAVAAQAPALVRRAICISGFVQGRWGGILSLGQRWARGGPIGRMLFNLVFWAGQLTPTAYRYFWSYFVADRQALDAYPRLAALLAATYPSWKALDLDAMFAYYAVMPAIDISGWLPRIAAPTLVLAGSRDAIVPPEQSRLIARTVPNAELAVIEGAGHLLLAERPAEYRRIIDDWLDRT